MTEPGRWLDERDPPAPPTVRRALDPWLAGTDPTEPLEDRLAGAALRALEAVVAVPSERSMAHTLLAADALLTYACEAAAERGPDALVRLTGELSFERMSHLMPDSP